MNLTPSEEELIRKIRSIKEAYCKLNLEVVIKNGQLVYAKPGAGEATWMLKKEK